jgi:hypothetical protein
MCLALAGGVLASLTACSEEPTGPRPVEPDLEASVVQLRFEEGSTTLHLDVHNRGDAPVEVSSVRLDGSTLTTPEAQPVVDADRLIEPGQTLTAPTRYVKPDCSGGDDPPVLRVTLSDGTVRDVELDDSGRALVDSLAGSVCGLRRVRETLRIRFLPRWRIEKTGGTATASGVLAIDRVPSSSEAADLDIVDLRGSVLLDFTTAEPADASQTSWRTRVPATFTVTADQDHVRLPVTLVPNGRCDAHALSQSSQTFLLNVFIQPEGLPEQRLVLSPTMAARGRIFELIRHSCGV